MKPGLQQAHGMQLALDLVLLAVAPSALAYLDPSTGSMVVSAIVGIFASIALAVKTYWYRLKNLFKGKTRSAEEPRVDPGRNSPGEG